MWFWKLYNQQTIFSQLIRSATLDLTYIASVERDLQFRAVRVKFNIEYSKREDRLRPREKCPTITSTPHLFSNSKSSICSFRMSLMVLLLFSRDRFSLATKLHRANTNWSHADINRRNSNDFISSLCFSALWWLRSFSLSFGLSRLHSQSLACLLLLLSRRVEKWKIFFRWPNKCKSC